MKAFIKARTTSFVAAGLVASLLLGGCAGGAGSGAADASSAQDAEPTQAVKFHGVRLTMPEDWQEEDWNETIEGWEDCRYWHGEGESFGAGGVCALTSTYEQFQNTDTQMPDPSDPDQQKIKASLDAGFKALDTRIYLASAVSVYGLEVEESDVALDEVGGCAVWSVEGKTESGYVYSCSIPLNNRLVMLVLASQGDALDSDQQAILDALKLPKKTDAKILSQAKRMKGKTQDEVMDFLLEDAKIPAKSTSSSGSGSSSSSGSSGYTGYSSGSGSSGSSSSSSSSNKVTEIGGDTYVEDEDGNVTSFGEDGSVTRYTDDGITTFNSDGTKEWTDGWGTVVRDTNGDGDPDIVSYDSGETWSPAR